MLKAVVHILALACVAGLLGFALTGEEGRLAILKLQNQEAELEEQIALLEHKNRELELVLGQFKTSESLAEKTARESFGMLRPDEIVFIEP